MSDKQYTGPKKPKTEAKKQYTEITLARKFRKLGYNMLDPDLTAKKAIANPKAECAEIKALCHKALAGARDAVQNDDLAKANSQFAFAYQMRCVSDWIYVNLLGNSGDRGHAKYLELEREFGKLSAGKKALSAQEKKDILKAINAIHD